MSVPCTVLGLRLRAPRLVAATVLAVFAAYLATMPRAVGIFDAGELAVAAYELGLGHPPGQPLHALLGWLASHLPFVSPAVGLHALSALASALVVVPLFALVEALVDDVRPATVAVVLGAASLHGVVWEAATRLEVYPLAVLFGVHGLALLAVAGGEGEKGAPPLRTLFASGVAFGLSAAANPVLAVVAALASVPFLARRAWVTAKAFGVALAGGIVGLLPYAHLAVAAGRDEAFVWGGLDSRDEVVHFLAGRDFGRNVGVSFATWAEQLAALVEHLAADRLFVAFLIAGVAGALLVARRGAPRIAASLLITFAVPFAFVASNRIFRVDVPDYLGYFGLPFAMSSACAVVVCDVAMRSARSGFLAPLVLVVSTLLGSPIVWERSRADDDVPMRLARAALDEMPRGAFLIVDSDHFAGPLLYAQRVERARPDVIVVVRGLLSSSWYLRFLSTMHPELAAYPVRGPGGRDGRLRRMLAANARRPVRVEHLALAAELGTTACAGGILVRTGAECAHPTRPDVAPLVRIASYAARLPAGAIDGKSELAAVTYRLGVDLYRLGHTRDAFFVLLLGVPSSMRRGLAIDPASIPDGDRLVGPELRFRRQRALGDPARNAFVAGTLLARVGRVDEAVLLASAAARDGLPEAIELIERAAR